MKKRLRGLVMASLLALALCAGCAGGDGSTAAGGGGGGGGNTDPDPPTPKASVPTPIEPRVARLGAENLLVVWDKWADGDPPGGFTVERKGPGASAWTEIARTGAATIHFIDRDLPTGGYSYRIGAIDAEGLTAWTQPVEFDLDYDPQPARPTRLKGYSSGQGEIYLRWDDNSDNETGFVIGQLSSSYWYWNTQFTPIAVLPANTTEFTLRGLIPHTYYYLAVKAVNGSVYSEPTEMVNIKVRTTPNFVEYKLLAPNSDTNRTRYTYDERGLLSEVGYEINTSNVFRMTQTYGGPWGHLTGYYQGSTFVNVEITDTDFGEMITRRDDGVLIANNQYNERGDLILAENYNLSPDRTYSTRYSSVTHIPNQYGLDDRTPSYVSGGNEIYTAYIYDARLRDIGSENRTTDAGGELLSSYINYNYGQNRVHAYGGSAGPRTEYYQVPDGDGTRTVAYWAGYPDQTIGRYVTTYDGSGQITSDYSDANRDGYPESRSRTTYFEDGSLRSYYLMEDYDSDGDPNYSIKQTCAENGGCVYSETYGDGTEPPPW